MPAAKKAKKNAGKGNKGKGPANTKTFEDPAGDGDEESGAAETSAPPPPHDITDNEPKGQIE